MDACRGIQSKPINAVFETIGWLFPYFRHRKPKVFYKLQTSTNYTVRAYLLCKLYLPSTNHNAGDAVTIRATSLSLSPIIIIRIINRTSQHYSIFPQIIMMSLFLLNRPRESQDHHLTLPCIFQSLVKASNLICIEQSSVHSEQLIFLFSV